MKWDLNDILKCISKKSDTPNYMNYSVLLLNQPIQNEQNFISLWNQASLRAIADGGGNQWDLLVKKYPGSVKRPQIASGDFDSLHPDVLKLFKSDVEVEVIHTEDQDETDFTKALRISADRISKNHPDINTIFAFCETSGRFDQIIANVETLFLAQSFTSGKQIFLMSSTSMTWLLPQGTHQILFDADKNYSESHFKINYCSLIPIGSPCKVTTIGLKWNLQNDILSFGRMVSTSNEIEKDAKIVTITTSDSLLWSMEFEA